MKDWKLNQHLSSDEKSSWIFLILFGDALPEGYIQICEKFAKDNITVVPIKFDQFTEVMRNFNKVQAIVIEDSLKAREEFQAYFRRYLSMAMNSKKLTLYHFSSFTRNQKLIKQSRTYNYMYCKLPMSVENLCKRVTVKYFENNSNKSFNTKTNFGKIQVL